MLKRGVLAAMRAVRRHSKNTAIVFFCVFDNLFSVRFLFYALVELQMN